MTVIVVQRTSAKCGKTRNSLTYIEEIFRDLNSLVAFNFVEMFHQKNFRTNCRISVATKIFPWNHQFGMGKNWISLNYSLISISWYTQYNLIPKPEDEFKFWRFYNETKSIHSVCRIVLSDEDYSFDGTMQVLSSNQTACSF